MDAAPRRPPLREQFEQQTVARACAPLLAHPGCGDHGDAGPLVADRQALRGPARSARPRRAPARAAGDRHPRRRPRRGDSRRLRRRLRRAQGSGDDRHLPSRLLRRGARRRPVRARRRGRAAPRAAGRRRARAARARGCRSSAAVRRGAALAEASGRPRRPRRRRPGRPPRRRGGALRRARRPNARPASRARRGLASPGDRGARRPRARRRSEAARRRALRRPAGDRERRAPVARRGRFPGRPTPGGSEALVPGSIRRPSRWPRGVAARIQLSRRSGYTSRPRTTPKTVCRQVAWAKARGFVRSGGTPGVPRAG